VDWLCAVRSRGDRELGVRDRLLAYGAGRPNVRFPAIADISAARQHALKVRGYIPDGATNRLGCAISLGWIFLSLPIFLMLLMTGGGCEGATAPCKSNHWLEWLLIGIVLLLGLVTTWTVRQLQSGRRGGAWWAALVAAPLLVGIAAFFAWQLSFFF